MDVYQYLVDVVKQVEGGWELPLNCEVSLAKDNLGIVDLIICSGWVDCTIPIESIRSEGDKIIVNNKISVGVTHDNFIEINSSESPYAGNLVSPKFIEKLIQDCKIDFRVCSKDNTIYFHDDHTVRYGLWDFNLSESEVRYLGTTEVGMELFNLGKGVELSIPKDAKIIIDLD